MDLGNFLDNDLYANCLRGRNDLPLRINTTKFYFLRVVIKFLQGSLDCYITRLIETTVIVGIDLNLVVAHKMLQLERNRAFLQSVFCISWRKFQLTHLWPCNRWAHPIGRVVPPRRGLRQLSSRLLEEKLIAATTLAECGGHLRIIHFDTSIDRLTVTIFAITYTVSRKRRDLSVIPFVGSFVDIATLAHVIKRKIFEKLWTLRLTNRIEFRPNASMFFGRSVAHDNIPAIQMPAPAYTRRNFLVGRCRVWKRERNTIHTRFWRRYIF